MGLGDHVISIARCNALVGQLEGRHYHSFIPLFLSFGLQGESGRILKFPALKRLCNSCYCTWQPTGGEVLPIRKGNVASESDNTVCTSTSGKIVFLTCRTFHADAASVGWYK